MGGTEADDDDRVGTTVAGKYRIDKVLGRGGMGAVYQATHTTIGKRVALKFLDREAARDLDAVTRFQREAEAASAVESAHIVQIFDSGRSDDGRPYLVMEMLAGEDLRARLKRETRIPLPDVVHIAGQVLRALARAHAAGIVHRDLKPDNVFLCRRDDDPMFVKIVDFGISKVSRKEATVDTLTRRGVVLGTAFYMSPEQAQAFRDLDGRTDLYSLGAIMFEALAGRPPHVGSVYEAVLVDICTKDAPDLRSLAPDVPEAIADVIAKALARDRARRYQTPAEMYDALAMAAPGLLRTGGPGSGRAELPSLPEPDLTRDAASATASGTAVHPEAPVGRRVQALRTLVLVVTVALGAFVATLLLMPTPTPAPAPPRAAAAATEGRVPTTASASAGKAPPTASTAAPSAVAAPDAAAPVKPARPTERVAARPSATAAPKPSATAPTTKPTTGVASGLTLETSGP